VIPGGPPEVAHLLVGVIGPAAVALAGAVVALRRSPGVWRTVLLTGLAVAGLVPALWWLVSLMNSSLTFVPYVAYLCASVLVSLAELGALATVVTAALLGREPEPTRPPG